MTRPALALLVVVITTACGSPRGSANVAADVEAIAAVNQAYVDATVTANVNALLDMMTSDVVLLPPGGPALEGSEAARGWYRWFHEIFTVVSDTALIEETVVMGEWAYIRGSYVMRTQEESSDSIVRSMGKFSTMLRRQDDGTWKIARDMWNTSLPPDQH